MHVDTRQPSLRLNVRFTQTPAKKSGAQKKKKTPDKAPTEGKTENVRHRTRQARVFHLPEGSQDALTEALSSARSYVYCDMQAALESSAASDGAAASAEGAADAVPSAASDVTAQEIGSEPSQPASAADESPAPPQARTSGASTSLPTRVPVLSSFASCQFPHPASSALSHTFAPLTRSASRAGCAPAAPDSAPAFAAAEPSVPGAEDASFAVDDNDVASLQEQLQAAIELLGERDAQVDELSATIADLEARLQARGPAPRRPAHYSLGCSGRTLSALRKRQ